MGCFNQIGFVSGLPIQSGDPIVLIFVSKKKYHEELQGAVYPDDIFAPCLLPIFGSYNDYGGIEDIIEDENTKFIEDFFGMEIEDELIGYIHDQGRERQDKDQKKNQKVLNDLTFCMEKREVYDLMSSKKILSWNESYLGELWLTRFGFVKSEEKSTDERYDEIWKCPGWDKYILVSDGTWSHLADPVTHKQIQLPDIEGIYGVYHPSDLAAVLTHFYIPYNIPISQQEECVIDLSYDISAETRKKNDISLTEKRDLLASLKAAGNTPDEETISSFFELLRDDGDRWIKGITKFKDFLDNNQNSLLRHIAGVVYTEPFRKLATDYVRFNSYMHGINAMYYPNTYGNQSTEWDFYTPLYKLYNKLITNKVKREKAEMYE